MILFEKLSLLLGSSYDDILVLKNTQNKRADSWIVNSLPSGNSVCICKFRSIHMSTGSLE